jgi:hypothetical protein
MYPALNPMVTFIPLVMVTQFINKLYVPCLILVFWAWPMLMAQWGFRTPSENINMWRYFFYWILWTILYILPLIIIVALEAVERGAVNSIVSSTFANPVWYAKSLGETMIAVVVVCDVLYVFLAREEKNAGDLLIDDYLKAVRNEALNEADVPLLNSNWPGASSQQAKSTPQQWNTQGSLGTDGSGSQRSFAQMASPPQAYGSPSPYGQPYASRVPLQTPPPPGF